MFNRYLVTGATGFLGHTVVHMLANRHKAVTALVLPEDPGAQRLPEGVDIALGDVTDPESLEPVFASLGKNACVIHCAGLICIDTVPGPMVRKVNVEGTRHVVDLCRRYGIRKLVYVSSVHAIPERKDGCAMTEIRDFSPQNVSGEYAKTKAEATAYVLEAARQGLNASVVQPSGIVGPQDYAIGSLSSMIISYCKGKLPMGVEGGYDFVDVRDVAAGILACCEKGRPGECYILSAEYVSIRRMLDSLCHISKGNRVKLLAPVWLAKAVSPFAEWVSKLKKEKPYFTPYAVSVLGSNGLFSHAKAARELGYSPRRFSVTLRDTYHWLKGVGYC